VCARAGVGVWRACARISNTAPPTEPCTCARCVRVCARARVCVACCASAAAAGACARAGGVAA
jgi:hypothetical protein